MKSLSQRIRERHKTASAFNQSIFRNEDGAIDLASIMVGIIVIGLIGGVIAATIFAVIPWTQDNAAKQQLDSVSQAENAYMGMSSATPSPLPIGYTPNSFTDSPGLASAGLLQRSPTYCVVATNGGKDFQSFSASGTGKIWSSTDSNPTPVAFSGTLPTVCEGLTTATIPSVNTNARLKFGLTVPDGPLSNEVNAVASMEGEYPGLVTTYKDWTSPFNSAEVQAVYDKGSQPMITWEPFDASVGGATQSNYTLASIYNGQHDAYINQWIASIKAQNTPKPILLRFAHEMNGNWYPWSEQTNGNAAGDYIKAWHYVHDKFTAAGIDSSKVQWVWAPNVNYTGSTDIYGLYPGNQYVDLMGVDGFNFGNTDQYHTWTAPWDVFSSTLGGMRYVEGNNTVDGSVANPGKKIIVTETASVPTEGANSQGQWIKDMVYWLNHDSNNSQDVVGFVWFDQVKYDQLNLGQSSATDWRLESSTEAQQAMKDALSQR